MSIFTLKFFKIGLQSTFLSFFLGILFSYSQTTYYVSKSGNDSNNGTSLNTSFLTIGKAISVISAGDKIYIRHGVYHEDLTLNNLDATSSNKTLISNYNEEKVIIDGTIPISNTWLDDQIGGTPVKKFKSFTFPKTQFLWVIIKWLWQDGLMLNFQIFQFMIMIIGLKVLKQGVVMVL